MIRFDHALEIREPLVPAAQIVSERDVVNVQQRLAERAGRVRARQPKLSRSGGLELEALRGTLQDELRARTLEHHVRGPTALLHEHLVRGGHRDVPRHGPDRRGDRVDPQITGLDSASADHADQVAHAQHVAHPHPHIAVQLHLPSRARGELHVLRGPRRQVQAAHGVQARGGHVAVAEVGPGRGQPTRHHRDAAHAQRKVFIGHVAPDESVSGHEQVPRLAVHRRPRACDASSQRRWRDERSAGCGAEQPRGTARGGGGGAGRTDVGRALDVHMELAVHCRRHRHPEKCPRIR